MVLSVDGYLRLSSNTHHGFCPPPHTHTSTHAACRQMHTNHHSSTEGWRAWLLWWFECEMSPLGLCLHWLPSWSVLFQIVAPFGDAVSPEGGRSLGVDLEVLWSGTTLCSLSDALPITSCFMPCYHVLPAMKDWTLLTLACKTNSSPNWFLGYLITEIRN